MPRVGPFDGLLFDPAVAGDLAAVTAPPYDVIDDEERDRLYRASPHNITHVDLAPGDDGYRAAGSLLRRWVEAGVLAPVGRPAAYPYEMAFLLGDRPRRVRGLIVEVGVEPFGGGILPHERTLSAPIEDRLALLRAARANLSPIYATIPGPSAAAGEALDRAATRPPDREVTDPAGVRHRLWIERDAEHLGAALRHERILIADGHHRYRTALAYREEMRRSEGPGPWDAVMMLLVDAGTEDPPVLPIHRVVRVDPLPPIDGERVPDLPSLLARLGTAAMGFGAAFREDGTVVHLVGRLQGPPPAVLALHRGLLDHMEGVQEVRYVPEAEAADDAVRAGRADLALFLPPARVEDVLAVVGEGGTLPQKSTFFWPKPLTGMVIRPLEAGIGAPAVEEGS